MMSGLVVARMGKGWGRMGKLRTWSEIETLEDSVRGGVGYELVTRWWERRRRKR